jgi:hypothetical protein
MKSRRSSGNTFRDLGSSAVEAATLKIRSDRIIRLSKLTGVRGLIQAQAAELVDVTEARIRRPRPGQESIDSASTRVIFTARPCRRQSRDRPWPFFARSPTSHRWSGGRQAPDVPAPFRLGDSFTDGGILPLLPQRTKRGVPRQLRGSWPGRTAGSRQRPDAAIPRMGGQRGRPSRQQRGRRSPCYARTASIHLSVSAGREYCARRSSRRSGSSSTSSRPRCCARRKPASTARSRNARSGR